MGQMKRWEPSLEGRQELAASDLKVDEGWNLRNFYRLDGKEGS